jgi:hypothetical protein
LFGRTSYNAIRKQPAPNGWRQNAAPVANCGLPKRITHTTKYHRLNRAPVSHFHWVFDFSLGETETMKQVLAIACVSLFALPLAAQQSPTQPVTIQMQCRDMATTGNYLAPNETMISNKACHAVNVQRMDSSVPTSNAQPTAAASTTAPAAASSDQQYSATVLPVVAANENPIRVVLMDSASWQARGWTSSADKNSTAAAPPPAAGEKEVTDPKLLTDDLTSGFNHQCPQAIVTENLETATFAVTLQREKKNRWSERDNIIVYNREGDHIFSASSKSLTDPLQSACQAIVTAAKR